MIEERALIGAKEIAEYLRWHPQTLLQKSAELQAAGVLMKIKIGKKGRQRKLYTFPSLLQRYLIAKHKITQEYLINKNKNKIKIKNKESYE